MIFPSYYHVLFLFSKKNEKILRFLFNINCNFSASVMRKIKRNKATNECFLLFILIAYNLCPAEMIGSPRFLLQRTATFFLNYN
jgi:hypothetical protein